MGNEQLLRIGARIENFEIREVLGVGGFGVTYKAWDRRLERWVALKEFLPIDLALREHNSLTVHARSDRTNDYAFALARFLDEAKTLARFRHPNIVRVSQFIETNGTAYLVMDYEQGVSLSQYLKAKPQPVDEPQLRAWFLPILRGLAEVHKTGFLHRDIKPGNIYLRDVGDPLLIDFGAARQAIGEQTRSITGIVSTGYAPIEQYGTDAKKQGPWTDLYAIGATLYRCIAARDPLDAPTRQSALFDGDAEPMTPATALGAGRYSAPLLELVDALLVIPFRERPQSAEEVLDWMDSGVRPAPGIAPVTSTTDHDRVSASMTVASPRESSRSRAAAAPASVKRVAPSTNAPESAGGRGVVKPVAAAALVLVLAGAAYVAYQQFAETDAPPGTASAGAAAARTSGSEADGPRATDFQAAAAVEAAAAEPEPELAEQPVGAARDDLLSGNSILLIDSTPTGADVALDGVKLGTTPFESQSVLAGNYTLTISTPDFKMASFDVTLEDNKVYAQAVPLEMATGELTVLSEPSGALILIDGESTGERTPATLSGLAAGNHTLQLVRDDFAPLERNVAVSADSLTRVSEVLAAIRYGQLELQLKPAGARVTLPDIDPAYTPGMRLPVGDYRVRVSANGYRETEQRVQVRDGETSNPSIALDPITVALQVRTEPPDVPVAIAELGQSYAPGMRVPLGRYTLKVAAGTYGGVAYAAAETTLEATEAGASASLQLLRAVDAGKVFRDSLRGGGEGPELVVLPLGRFRMGDAAGGDSEGPVRTVTISQPFAMMKYEVTFTDYERFATATRGQRPNDEGWGRANRPVINVSWQDAQSYAAWLSAQTGHRYRLPSEAEWEYAARAGTTSSYSWGDTISCSQARYEQLGGSCGNERRSIAVGSFDGNAFGLHDLHGNVWEWVEDCWFDNYAGAPTDGSARTTAGGCDRRARRGGSWFNAPGSLRAAARSNLASSIRDNLNGFRLVRELD